MKKKQNNTQGSALVWVLAIALIFSILGVSIGWVALSMNSRSVANYKLQQDYFTSRSAVDAMFQELNGINIREDATEVQKKNAYATSICKYLNDNLLNGNKSIANGNGFTDFFGAIGNETEEITAMGSCTVKGWLSKGHVFLEGRTGGDTAEDAVCLEAYRKPTSTDWANEGWSSQLGETMVVGSTDTITNDGANANNIDVAVYTVYGTKRGDLTIAKDATTEKKAIFIYIKDGATLDITGVKVDGKDSEKWFEGEDKNDWSNYYGPDIFIYIEPGGTLNFSTALKNGTKSTPYPFYICGKTEGTKKPMVKTSQTEKIAVYYDQDVILEVNSSGAGDWLTYVPGSTKNSPNRVPISGYKQAGIPSTTTSGLMANTWTVLQYSDGNGK